MTVEYIWEIRRCVFEPGTGGIIGAYWAITARSAEKEVRREVYTPFNPDPSSPNFTQYENVSEDQVLQWVWDVVKKDKVEADALMKLQISSYSATYAEGLPWAQE